ncbi:MAG: hypothetical protein HOP97_00705, partial [Terrabacter sp.]|nr:hypothetical protein [Terrabacter sp.]
MRAYVRLVLIAVVGLLAAGVPPVSAQAAGAGSIVGTVRAEGGSPLASVRVTAYRLHSTWGTWWPAVETTTDAAGAYALNGLDPAAYRVGFVDTTNRHFAEFHENEKSVEVAKDVPVVDGASSTVDAELARTAAVTGTVTKGASVPASGIQVSAHRWVEPTYSGMYGYWAYVAGATTDASGAYDLVGLDAGEYRVRFSDNSGALAPEWWDDALTVTAAKPVQLVRGQTAEAVDARLVPASHITGRVTTLSGEPVEGAPVAVYERDAVSGFWTTRAYARTSSSGQYDVGRLPAGTYRVGVPGPDDNQGQSDYLEQYWPNSTTVASAGDIIVGGAATVADKNLVMVRPSGMTGTVRDTTGAPLPSFGVRPFRWNASTGEWLPEARSTWTNASGQYSVRGLRAGRYTLVFEASTWPSPYLETWWGPSPVRTGAVAVDIADEEMRGGLDATIERGSTVSGTVRTTSGQPIGWSRVTAYRQSSQGAWVEVDSGLADGDGDYELAGLMSGTYRLRFEHDDHATTWWGGATSLEAAPSIAVGADSIRAATDVTMAAATTKPDPVPTPT